MTSTRIELKVPSVGESVTAVEIGEWLKRPGDSVAKDETIVILETDKATMELPSPSQGRLAEILQNKGARVKIGDVIGAIDTSDASDTTQKVSDFPPPAPPTATTPGPAASANETAAQPRIMPAAARLMAETGLTISQVEPTGPGGRILKEDVLRSQAAAPPPPAPAASTPPSTPKPGTPESRAPAPAATTGNLSPAPLASAPSPLAPDLSIRQEEKIPMTLLRRRIAERLVQAQQQAALLTTFNEIDMSAVQAIRKDLQERFQQRYQVKLGLSSFFVKAVVEGLKQNPQLNAEIRDQDIVYRNYFDIGVAIGGGRGLVVPVLRHAEQLSFAEIERAIATYAQKIQENKIKPEDLQGGTFTITNGGVYGSLLSTPIVNPPQSGVLGMHAIQDRPVVVSGQIAIRPMMYVALTYDHRIVDGREAVTFLKRVKELIENPVRILIEI